MNNPFEAIEARLCNIESLILDLKHKPEKKQNEEPSERLLTIKEAAELLSLTVPTIYSKVSKGELPVMKRSKRLYFSHLELMEYIKTGRRLTNYESSHEAINVIRRRQR